MTWHILLFLFFTAVGSGVGILFFFKKKGNRFANILLGIYTLLFSYELLNNCLKWSGFLNRETFVHLTFTQFPLWVIYGPLLYVYVRKVTQNKDFQRNDVLFLIPILAIVILNSPFYLLGSQQKLNVLNTGTFGEHTWLPPFSIDAVIVLMFFYGFLIYLDFGPRRTPTFNENKWLKWFVGSYLGFALAFATYIYLTRFGIMNPNYDYFVDIVIVFFIASLSFFGFVQPEIFEGKTIKEVIPFVKYQKTGLSNALSLEMRNKLEEIMTQDKIFLENTLRLDDVARILNLSRNHTSQVINQHFNLSFFDFVNQYRIEEAKRLMTLGSPKSTMTQIAYDCGFNNRASFYKAFKKFEKQNPTEYLMVREAS
nr:AraC family transcriptional regulator [Allomuricauda sp.]